jgi:hypothetical protein
MQRQAGEDSSIEEDDEDDDDKEVHLYDWLDSMAEKREHPEGSSLSIEGRGATGSAIVPRARGL